MEEIQNPELAAMLDRLTAAGQAIRIGNTIRTCEQEKAERERQQAFERMGIFARYQHCTFDEIEREGVPGRIGDQYKAIRKYADNIAVNAKAGVGLILKGSVGTMKTTLAVAVLLHYYSAGGNGLFVPMVSMLDNIFTMKERNREEWTRYEERLRNCGLLVLDDLGAEYHQEWVLSKVDAIVTERYNRMKPIIATTNLSSEEMKGKYCERIIDRLAATSLQIKFAGDSLRGRPGGRG